MAKREAAADKLDYGLDADAEEWENVNTGLGDAWPIMEEPLIGYFLGTQQRDVPDPNNPGQTRLSNAHQFAPVDSPQDVVFVWGSAMLDAALNEAVVGDKYRIDYAGERSYSAKNGQPRRVKTYRVRHAASKNAS